MITWHSDITGAHEGGTAAVSFTIAAECTAEVSFVSYTAPSDHFDENTADQQKLFAWTNVTFTGGTHTLTVAMPSCFFQVDFVRGGVIEHLSKDNLYGTRLIAGVNGGEHSCQQSTSTSTGTSMAWPESRLSAAGAAYAAPYQSASLSVSRRMSKTGLRPARIATPTTSTAALTSVGRRIVWPGVVRS